VFAFWAVRAEAATPEVLAILRRSYEAGLRHFDSLVGEESDASGLSPAVVEDYLRHALHFELDAGDLEGLAAFYRLAAEDGLIPEARPLAYLGR
jgi:predicted solute-binding protein